MRSFKDEGRVATTGKPGGNPKAYRKSDVPIRARKWGNAHGAKGDTCSRRLDGNAHCTQRQDKGGNGSRVDSQASPEVSAGEVYSANAPVH